MTTTLQKPAVMAEPVFSNRMLLGTRIKLQIALHSLIRKYLLFLAANKKNYSVLLESSRL